MDEVIYITKCPACGETNSYNNENGSCRECWEKFPVDDELNWEDQEFVQKYIKSK